MTDFKGFTEGEVSSFLCKKLEKLLGKKIINLGLEEHDSDAHIIFNYRQDDGDTISELFGQAFTIADIVKEMQEALPKVKIAAKKNNVQSEEINLESTVNDLGKYVTQILHFSGGNKRTVKGVISSSMKEGTLTKFMVKKGYMVMVNINNVDMIEVFTEK